MDIGPELADARRRRGLSLQELSARTKIPVATLRSIECRIASLPRTIHTRGFLRAYAAEVGCDPQDVVARYRAEIGPDEIDHEQLARLAEGFRPEAVGPGRLHVAEIDSRDRRRAIVLWVTTVSLVIASGFAYFVLAGSLSVTRPPPSAPLTPSAPPVTAAAPSPPGSPSVATGGAAVPAAVDAESPLRLLAKSEGPCWLSARADGEQVVYRMLNPREEVRLSAREEIVLRVGDASMLALTMNGVPLRRLGGAAEAVTVHLTPRTYRDLTAAPDRTP